MKVNLNKLKPVGYREDKEDGFVFFCPTCKLYGPTLDKTGRCTNCGQVVDLEKEEHIKGAKLKYLTEEQWSNYYDYMLSEIKTSFLEFCFCKMKAMQISIFDLLKELEE